MDCSDIKLGKANMASIQGLCPTQVNIYGRFSQPSPCCPAGAITNVLHCCSSQQVLTLTAINLIQGFNATKPGGHYTMAGPY